jgi:arabinan endo-1,5-alpha-L-arabinosidase
MHPQPFFIVLAAAFLGGQFHADAALGADPEWLRIENIRIRDPFILVDPEAGKYYMYGNKSNRREGARGWECYVSDDLKMWAPPVPVFAPPEGFWGRRDFWAPEVHRYRGRYYLFGTLSAEDAMRGTQIFVADEPLGPFVPHSDRAATPHDWMALDGTLFIEEGVPWMVFCHEWVQIRDGTIDAVRLSDDLSRPVGEPFTLLRGSGAAWCRAVRDNSYVTDGPWLHRLPSGRLLLLWSSVGKGDYTVGVARSESDTLRGPWRHDPQPLVENGGHCMIFCSLDGRLLMVLHGPNRRGQERARFFEVRETDTTLEVTPLDAALKPLLD